MQNYKLIRSIRKTLSLQVKGCEIIVKVPLLTSKKIIENFLEKNKNWIEEKLEIEKNKQKISGKDLELLESKAKNYIPLRVKFLAEKYNLSYNSIKINKAKTKWGSCSNRKNLNFSYRLMVMPIEIIDYVIIHELAHLKELNHSKVFWKEVENMMGDYKIYKKKLKQEEKKFNIDW